MYTYASLFIFCNEQLNRLEGVGEISLSRYIPHYNFITPFETALHVIAAATDRIEPIPQ
jgi:hypothetical protein